MQGISASELARRSDINKSAICRYLKGLITPKQNNVVSLAKVLHVDPVWLMGYDTANTSTITEYTTAAELESKLKDAIVMKYSSINNFANICRIPQSTIFTILDRGLSKSVFGNVVKICQTLNISIDRLVAGEIVFNDDVRYEVAVSKLSKTNAVKFMAYYQGLLDSQG
jgi:transcriptional regulator with XRE-family HTH domain